MSTGPEARPRTQWDHTLQSNTNLSNISGLLLEMLVQAAREHNNIEVTGSSLNGVNWYCSRDYSIFYYLPYTMSPEV